MPIWSEVLAEILEGTSDGSPPDFDGVRRKYLVKLYQHTERPVILYASGWLQKESHEASFAIGGSDIQGFMEVTAGLGEGAAVDLILHSPGGSPMAAEAIVLYLRSRFSHIRVIVPNLAMSAATLICCAADEIVLGKHSFLGPTDPQILLATPLGNRSVPAQAILNQFDMAQRRTSDPEKMTAWLPMLNQYGPDLLVQCEGALDLSVELAKNWLETYMFKDLGNREDKAQEISEWFANHGNFKSHGRHIPRADLKDKLTISYLEDDAQLEDLSLSVFHSTTHTFSATPTAKIIENHLGRAFISRTHSDQK